MNVHSGFVEPTTPAESYHTTLWRNEDSGYHTSFTPGSLECLENSKESLNSVNQVVTPTKFKLYRPSKSRNTVTNVLNESPSESPVSRRGLKRSHEEIIDDTINGSVPTPTTMISGGIRKLRVTDSAKPCHAGFAISSPKSEYAGCTLSDLYKTNETAHAISFPSTPVKRICRTSCKLSPMKKSAKKINFTIHPLSCSSNGLQPVNKPRAHSKVVRTIQFRPEQKIDIIRMLHQKKVNPPLQKILAYLSNDDIDNFNSVSYVWCNIWHEVSNGKQKLEHFNFMRNLKENLENKDNVITPKSHDAFQIKTLKEVHNLLNAQIIRDTPRSPPGTPRTNKFKKFTKSASLDSRLQLLCVRCAQPAKVTTEISGEEWVECTSVTCAYQFCRSCNCDRHPGKTCVYDGPSPSKRKKSSCAVSSKKSRKNLRRLLL